MSDQHSSDNPFDEPINTSSSSSKSSSDSKPNNMASASGAVSTDKTEMTNKTKRTTISTSTTTNSHLSSLSDGLGAHMAVELNSFIQGIRPKNGSRAHKPIQFPVEPTAPQQICHCQCPDEHVENNGDISEVD